MRKAMAAVLFLAVLPACSKAPDGPSASGEVPAAEGAELREGDAVPLSDGGHFSWKFSERPKLGVVIVNLQAFGADGKPDTGYELVGEYGMPSMRHHDSGPRPFILNKKGHYLFPVEFSMPGEWEIVIRVSRDGKHLYEGSKLLTI
jgi:hypothetical protein